MLSKYERALLECLHESGKEMRTDELWSALRCKTAFDLPPLFFTTVTGMSIRGLITNRYDGVSMWEMYQITNAGREAIGANFFVAVE